MSDNKEKQPEQSISSMYAVIPAVVMRDKSLRPNAKLIYGEISTLTHFYGYCFSTNQYFANLFDLDRKTVSALINSLAKAGYITIEIVRVPGGGEIDLRKIWLNADFKAVRPPIHKNVDTPNNMDTCPQKCGDPVHKNVDHNNTSINNNTPIVPKIAPKVVTDMLADYAAGDAKLLEALLGFAEMRAKIRAPIVTEKTVDLLTGKLDKLSGGCSGTKIEMLEEAIVKNWKTVYAPKDGHVASKTITESEGLREWSE